MIFDVVNNFRAYSNLSCNFAPVTAYLESADLISLTIGRHEVSSSGAFALVSEYQPVAPDAGCIECHDRYIDIQLVAHGVERIGFCARQACVQGLYDAQKDFRKLEGRVDWLTLRPGSFAIFFPDDGHMPGVHSDEWNGMVKKIVIKVPVSRAGGA